MDNQGTLDGHIQDITLTVRIKDSKTINRTDHLLFCGLDKLGCASTSLDPYAYTWQAQKNACYWKLKKHSC